MESQLVHFFLKQLNLIKDALCPNGFITGDFNLDDEMLLRPYRDKISVYLQRHPRAGGVKHSNNVT